MSRRSRSTRSAEARLAEIDTVFSALAHESRRHILLVLRMRGGQLTAGEIAERFACTWPTTTRHLRQLERAGLVTVKKQGRERIYQLDTSRLHDVAVGWLRWFESGAPPSRRLATKRSRRGPSRKAGSGGP